MPQSADVSFELDQYHNLIDQMPVSMPQSADVSFELSTMTRDTQTGHVSMPQSADVSFEPGDDDEDPDPQAGFNASIGGCFI